MQRKGEVFRSNKHSAYPGKMSAEAAGGNRQPGAIPLLLGAQTISFLLHHSLHCSLWHREAATLKSSPASTQSYTESPFSVMAWFSNHFPSWKAGIHLHLPHPPSQTAWLIISSLHHLSELPGLLPLLSHFLLLPRQL